MGTYLRKNNITISKGNGKVSKSILIFNIPSIITCPNNESCKDHCYARKSEIRFPPVLPCRMRNLESVEQPTFIDDMLYLIDKSKLSRFRIHEAGDFYTQAYADKWSEIIYRSPNVRFYAYSKSPYRPDESLYNLNIVESILPDGSVNFGDKKWLFENFKKYKYKICPYGLTRGKLICGEHCTACLYNKYVAFLKH